MKYGWSRHSAAVGRAAGFRASSDDSRERPASVRYWNLECGSKGGFVFGGEGGSGGSLRVFALGRDRKLGHVCRLGGPVTAKT